MKIQIKKQENGKYLLLGEFEIGYSGEYEVRILCQNLSLERAKELQKKYER